MPIWQVKNDLLFRIIRLGKQSGIPAKLYILFQQLTRLGKKRAVFFPGRMNTGHAGDLRAIAVAAELRHFGWRVIVVPSWVSLEERKAILAAEHPDVVLLQQSAHPLNRPWLYSEYATIFDVDDADYAAEPDLVAACCRTASVSVVGNHHLAEVFREYGAPAVEVIWTGTYINSVKGSVPNSNRKNIICWAHSAPQDYPVEAEFIRNVILGLSAKQAVIFRVHGNKASWLEDYVKPIRAAGIEVEVFGSRRYRSFIRSLSDVSVGLQPVMIQNEFSRGKSFGKLLAYMAADVAVVASNTVDHPLFFRNRENGILADTLEEWIEACSYLLDNPRERENLTKIARKDFLERLTVANAAMRLDTIMNKLIKPPSLTTS